MSDPHSPQAVYDRNNRLMMTWLDKLLSTLAGPTGGWGSADCPRCERAASFYVCLRSRLTGRRYLRYYCTGCRTRFRVPADSPRSR